MIFAHAMYLSADSFLAAVLLAPFIGRRIFALCFMLGACDFAASFFGPAIFSAHVETILPVVLFATFVVMYDLAVTRGGFRPWKSLACLSIFLAFDNLLGTHPVTLPCAAMFGAASAAMAGLGALTVYAVRSIYSPLFRT